MKITNRLGLPKALVEAVQRDDYDPGEAVTATASQIVQPPQLVALTEKHWDHIEEDVIDNIWALFGKAVHNILERADDDYSIRESRYYASVGGYKISGKFDRLALVHTGNEFVLQDYKVTSVWSSILEEGGVKREWVEQLNVLAYILQANKVRVDRLEIVPFYRDWRKSERMRSPETYPANYVDRLSVGRWSNKKIVQYIEEQCKALTQARMATVDDTIKMPHCTKDETWYRGEAWAVMKAGRKSALKVEKTASAAADYCLEQGLLNSEGDLKPGIVIEHRKGTPNRCLDYCSAAPFCSQFAEWCEENGYDR